MIWEILTREIPYKDVDSSAVMWGVGNTSLHLPLPSTCPDGFKLLLNQVCYNFRFLLVPFSKCFTWLCIRYWNSFPYFSLSLYSLQCWKQKPNNRPTFAQILEHLDIAASELTSMGVEKFYNLQELWKVEIDSHLSHMKRIPRQTSPFSSDEEDLRKKEEIIQAAREKQELYEKMLGNVNNLYLELQAVCLQLEQREKQIRQKENLLKRRKSQFDQCIRERVERVLGMLNGPPAEDPKEEKEIIRMELIGIRSALDWFQDSFEYANDNDSRINGESTQLESSSQE